MRALLVLVALCSTASAAPADDWLAALADRVIGDITAGRPLVVDVHVPLCDSSIIACGNAKLGDGDNPDTNLYWATTPGFGEWFARRGGGWKRTAALRGDATGDKDVLALVTYRRTLATPARWRTRGAPKTFDVEVVIHGWRGKAIDRALAAYAADLSGASPAQIVAWVGHNRLMDLDHFDWPAPARDVKGAIAIACQTAPYMKDTVPAATRVPLLMTDDFLFANAAPLEAAVLAFGRGGSYAQIRHDAAEAYAGVQESTLAHVLGAFTNPGDKRW